MIRPGSLVAPNVRLERLLGGGGMGSVWVARHETLNTQVAVKFMSEELAHDADALARFTREATAAAQIKSPHVVQVFDHGVTADKIPYIVMELLQGEDLDARLERVGTLSVRETALVVKQTSKALRRAHRLGIVHRDVKPANLFLVDADGDVFVKVLDFGIAKTRGAAAVAAADGDTTTGTLIGTPHYLSPEQIQGSKSVDGRTDLWALAVVAYECLTGRRPFNGDTVGAICIAIHAGEFPPPTSLRPDLPAGVDAWFARAFARDVEARFASAEDLAAALEAAMPGALRSAPPPAPSEEDAIARAPRSMPLVLTPSAPHGAPPAVAVSGPPATLGGSSVRSRRARSSGSPFVPIAIGALLVGGVAAWIHREGRPVAPAPAATAMPAPPAPAATTHVDPGPVPSSPPVAPPAPTAPPTTTAAPTPTATPLPTASASSPAIAPPPPAAPPPHTHPHPAPTASPNPSPAPTIKDRGF
jgi:serine/threonine-protein kinase